MDLLSQEQEGDEAGEQDFLHPAAKLAKKPW